MPRSSGGGSHSGGSRSSAHSTGGGSHSSGYHSSSSSSSSRSYSSSGASYSSSRSYSSGSSHSGGSSRSYGSSFGTRTRTKAGNAFVGSQVYTNGMNIQRQTYSANDSPARRGRHPGRLLFYVCLVVMMTMAYIEIFSAPTRLDAPMDMRIVVRDSIGVIENEEQMEISLRSFLDATGITPAVITVTNESWNRYYRTLEDRAYDLYVSQFDDEQHWLIVYSQPAAPDPAFVDWRWESMAGDDTGKILTDEATTFFGKTLQKYLTMPHIGVGEAISRAFDETTEYLASSGPGAMNVLVAILIVLGTAAFGLFRSGYLPGRGGRPDSQPVTPNPSPAPVPEKQPAVAREIACAYCGGVVPEGAVKCPHCGAGRAGKRDTAM